MSDEVRMDPVLDPAVDTLRWERMVARVTATAAPALARRAARPDPLFQLARWSRPVLAAAAAVIGLATTVILTADGGDGEAQPRLADALAPATVASWLATGEQPSADELLQALGDL